MTPKLSLGISVSVVGPRAKLLAMDHWPMAMRITVGTVDEVDPGQGVALVRPLLWLAVFAAGFRNVFGVAIVEPYDTYIPYDVYIAPGLVGMVLLFNGMQSSLAMVYDREMGLMRLLLTAPLPRWWILFAKLTATAVLSLAQAAAFVLVAWLPMAVQDFFEGSTSLGREQLKLWVIRVPEEAGSAAFLPAIGADLTEPASLGAFERALLPRRAAIIALPDLERLQVPANLPDIPRLRLDNPVPVFLPCGVEPDDGHRERRYSREIPHSPAPLEAAAVVAPIARSLARGPQFRTIHAVSGFEATVDHHTVTTRYLVHVQPRFLGLAAEVRESFLIDEDGRIRTIVAKFGRPRKASR